MHRDAVEEALKKALKGMPLEEHRFNARVTAMSNQACIRTERKRKRSFTDDSD